MDLPSYLLPDPFPEPDNLLGSFAMCLKFSDGAAT
jgi:hypothetical protein